MTEEQAINAYKERFGGFPYFLMMGASEEKIVEKVMKALESGEEIEAENDDYIY